MQTSKLSPPPQGRVSIRRQTIPGSVRFEDGPQFALILKNGIDSDQLAAITRHLSENGLTVVKTTSLNEVNPIILVELSNSVHIFQEANELKIMKNIQAASAVSNSTPSAAAAGVNGNAGGATVATATTTTAQKNMSTSKISQQSYSAHLQRSQLSASYNLMRTSESNFANGDMRRSNLDNYTDDKVITPTAKAFPSIGQFPGSISISAAPSSQLPSPRQNTTLSELIDFPLEGFSKHTPVIATKKQRIQRLNSIDPRILIFEKFKVINSAMFLNSNNNNNEEFEAQKILEKGLGIFTPAERLRITYSYLSKIAAKEVKFIEFLQDQKQLIEIVPLHEKKAILNDNIQSIEDYYGENISVYFEFLDFYQKWLAYPAIASIPTYIITSYAYSSKHFAQTTILAYSLFICIWTTLFYISWRRYESELQIKWGVFGKKIYKEDRNVRFKGVKRIKSTTMIEEEFYPQSKRIYLYLLSGIESLPLLIIAFLLKLIIFNLNGSIRSEDSILFFPEIAGLTRAGGFLHTIPLKDQILNVIMIVLIIKVNDIYTSISEKSTKRENHRTNNDFNSSLVIKRFIFDLINRFTHYFFIAFVIHDLSSLKSLMNSLFLLDEIRKIATESLVPWILKTIQEHKQPHQQQQQQLEQSNSNSAIKSQTHIQSETQEAQQILPSTLDSNRNRNAETLAIYADTLREIDSWQYDNFDDYIEVVAQIAFVTFFSAVSPLAALLSYLFNVFERHSDKFKLQNRLYRRPLPYKVTGIGAWNKVLLLISIICVYTNVAFLAFDYFDIYEFELIKDIQVCTDEETPFFDPSTQSVLVPPNPFVEQEQISWLNVYLSIFTLEHAIIIFNIALHICISYFPKWVRVYRRRMVVKDTTNPQ